ncbi:hypothetical protein [Epilithonimonas arachidiradicis]|uniref:WG repeat protein n=1 Tax=Epilithonimonas arachidiradicis TaxID=1617282 RepID=A0A420DCJ0_9FLAO|nr:hypothetical protein [Epilithonimonas arachidiradicis]RKE89562.1 hypothetical protein BXY58_0131 [Epilithonimonas arachidiradicis]GGG43475.1 hypothetical protein GCM10007332_01210 [Epilithonimonas arachidiradicis]
MKRTLTILTIILFNNCSTQIKLNKGNNVDFIQMHKPTPDGKFLIKNNTSDTYIIDPMGFFGKIFYLENDGPAPLMWYPEGYFYRFSDADCNRDLIILEPYKQIEANFTLCRDLSGSDLDVTKISRSNRYSYIVKSVHNKSTAIASGCKNYIENLERLGYKVLEDSISAKVPLTFDYLEK